MKHSLITTILASHSLAFSYNHVNEGYTLSARQFPDSLTTRSTTSMMLLRRGSKQPSSPGGGSPRSPSPIGRSAGSFGSGSSPASAARRAAFAMEGVRDRSPTPPGGRTGFEGERPAHLGSPRNAVQPQDRQASPNTVAAFGSQHAAALVRAKMVQRGTSPASPRDEVFASQHDPNAIKPQDAPGTGGGSGAA